MEDTEIVIRLYGITASDRNQLCARLDQESRQHGMPIKTEVSGDVLGDLNYEAILVACTVIQVGTDVIKTIHAILKPWLEEQQLKRKQAKEQEIKVEIVVDGTVVEPDETASDQAAAEPDETPTGTTAE